MAERAVTRLHTVFSTIRSKVFTKKSLVVAGGHCALKHCALTVVRAGSLAARGLAPRKLTALPVFQYLLLYLHIWK